MRRIRRDLNFAALCTIADRQVPVDVQARLQSNGIFINKIKDKD